MGEAYSIFGIALLLPFYMITTTQCFINDEIRSKRLLKSFLAILISPITLYLVWQKGQALIIGWIFRKSQILGTDYLLTSTNFLTGFLTLAVLIWLFNLLYNRLIHQEKRVSFFVYNSFVMILMGSNFLMVYELNLYTTIITCVVLPTVLYSLYYCIIDLRIRKMLRDAKMKDLSGINSIPLLAILVIYICTHFAKCVVAIVSEEDWSNLVGLSTLIGILLILLVFMSYNMIFININKTLQVTALTQEVQESQENVIIQFAEITEAKSGQTGQHIQRVSEYSRVLAKAMKLSEDEVETIRVASMMHDIGKLMIPSSILEKTEQLTREEYEIMKKHAQYGYEILKHAPGKIMEYARNIALEHHEKWDGTGYHGTRGNNISQAARIVAVADVFDALVSNRSYKKGWDPNRARDLIIENAGIQFDPTVVEAFALHFDEIYEVYQALPDIDFSENPAGEAVSQISAS